MGSSCSCLTTGQHSAAKQDDQPLEVIGILTSRLPVIFVLLP